MRKLASFFAVLTVVLLTMTPEEASAEPPLPGGLAWGASQEACREKLEQAGYSIFVNPEDYTASQSGMRTIKRDRMLRGIVSKEYVKVKDESERLMLSFHNEELYRLTVTYEGKTKEFAAKLIKETSDVTGQKAHLIVGKDSSIENYIWSVQETVVVFTCGYDKSMPAPLSVIDYRNEARYRQLREAGLI